jgi:hypothetical protein
MALASAATAGVCSVPCLASSTIWSASPDDAGKSAFKMLIARVESVLGSWNLVE